MQDLADAGDTASERIEVLLEELGARGARIERIVSHGQVSAEGFWYDQEQSEWVLVVAGGAVLEVVEEAGAQMMRLEAGDWVLLPARVRHRVAWTDPARATVWLAVFWR